MERVIPREAGKLNKINMFTELQNHIIAGSLLGDGSLTATGGGRLYRLQMVHSNKQHSYLQWKYERLSDMVKTSPTYYAKTNSWRFRTLSFPEFTSLKDRFYDGLRKIVPTKLNDIISNPLVLAIWYMDDGNIRREHGKVYGCMLNTQSFSFAENQRLAEFLYEKFSVKASLQRNHGKYRLYFGADSWKRFYSLIAPYVIESMRYKLP